MGCALPSYSDERGSGTLTTTLQGIQPLEKRKTKRTSTVVENSLPWPAHTVYAFDMTCGDLGEPNVPQYLPPQPDQMVQDFTLK